MKDKYRTPQLLPGAWYVTYTSDERMAPVYVQPVNIERNINGDYVADLKDNTLGEINVKEGDKLFAFYARVQLPVEDRDNPVLLEKGELFEQVEEERVIREQQKELEKRRARLRVERLTAGGTR
jgi:hypothetical protein